MKPVISTRNKIECEHQWYTEHQATPTQGFNYRHALVSWCIYCGKRIEVEIEGRGPTKE